MGGGGERGRRCDCTGSLRERVLGDFSLMWDGFFSHQR